ncbi:RNA polymerase sporulation sigma factor SigH [Kurthia massiliensis]|uniref:RNA polymerase sporulation sigma factor SigH n=1 Tax=Kurthia massiliensis TaxID=1033739 RepID=UPI000289E85C
MTDEQLVEETRQGDSEALDFLITKYKPLVRMKVKSYFLIGADKEDIIQEGMIGLFKAVRDFNDGHQASFKVFAELCITRQIITAIKTATRQKHMPLNSYVSLDKPVGDDEQASTLMDLLETDSSEDPANFVVHREQFLDMESRINAILSPFEQKVLALYIDGCSYQEIAEQLTRHVKSIDNALQRIKRKLEQQLTTT